MSRVPVLDGFSFRQQVLVSNGGIVWRAQQEALERDVLVAELDTTAPEAALRAEATTVVAGRIAQAKVRLMPGVVDVLADDHAFYLILEDIRSQPILTLLKDRKLGVEQAIKLTTSLAQGFAELHAIGVVYGGLRPRTLYLVDERDPLLPDFTPARFEAGKGENPPAELVGSAPYVAPEQIVMPEAVDTRADMFSLAMTIYALVTGQVPYGALEPSKILDAKLVLSIPSPCDLVPNFPEAFAGVLARLAQREPDDRYADWDEVLFDLHQAAQGIPPEVPNPDDSIIAPPNPEAHRKADRTIRLSSSELRRYRVEVARKRRFFWYHVRTWCTHLAIAGLIIGAFVWFFYERLAAWLSNG